MSNHKGMGKLLFLLQKLKNRHTEAYLVSITSMLKVSVDTIIYTDYKKRIFSLDTFSLTGIPGAYLK